MYRTGNGPSPVPKHLEHLAINLYHALRLARIRGPVHLILAGQDLVRMWPKSAFAQGLNLT